MIFLFFLQALIIFTILIAVYCRLHHETFDTSGIIAVKISFFESDLWGEPLYFFIPLGVFFLFVLPLMGILYAPKNSWSLIKKNFKISNFMEFWGSAFRFNNVSKPCKEKTDKFWEMSENDGFFTEDSLQDSGTSGEDLITTEELMRTWTLSCAAVKSDVYPGMLNRPDLLSPPVTPFSFGPRWELAGTNHSFMPIVMETV